MKHVLALAVLALTGPQLSGAARSERSENKDLRPKGAGEASPAPPLRGGLGALLQSFDLSEPSGPDSSYRRESVDPSKFELLHSSAPIRSSTLSPAGNLYGVYAGNKVVLYHVKDQKEFRSLAGHDGNIHDSGWSRDGKVFATSGYDGKVIVWDVGTGGILATYAPHSGYA